VVRLHHHSTSVDQYDAVHARDTRPVERVTVDRRPEVSSAEGVDGIDDDDGIGHAEH
jgi:hypothetical protein